MTITTIPRPLSPVQRGGPINPELPRIVQRAVAKRSLCNLGTTSAAGFPQVSAIHYKAVGDVLYANTRAGTRKARNIAHNPRVAVSVPVRRIPVGMFSQVMFQGTAELLAQDHPDVVELLEDGTLKSLTQVGELDLPDLVFLRITPRRRVNTFALGMSLISLIRNPLDAGDGYDLPLEEAQSVTA